MEDVTRRGDVKDDYSYFNNYCDRVPFLYNDAKCNFNRAMHYCKHGFYVSFQS